MCEVHEGINISIKGYLTRTILKTYRRNIMQSIQCSIINSITNGSINLYSSINLNDFIE